MAALLLTFAMRPLDPWRSGRYCWPTMKIVALLVTLSGFLLLPKFARAQSAQGFADEFGSDFRYLANNSEADAEDVLTSPLHFPDLFAADGLLRQPAFYYTLLGAGAAFGGSFALDQTVRAHLRDMPNGAANALEDSADAFVGGWTALLYGYGLYYGDERAREYSITAAEGAGVGTLITLALKYGFGRLRPRQDGHSHTKFFDGGQSFVSGETTPLFALSAGISEYFGNAWYAAVPAYSGALAMGFGRMGHDAHWLSDIAGAAIVGVGTTELLLYLHRRHAENPSRFRIFPIESPRATGAGISFEF
jgi:membrane-associated phospholipid phosphatase